MMDEARIHSDSPRWVWVAAIWGGIALFDATQNVFVMRAEGMHHYWVRLFFTLFVAWLPWALSTPLVFYLGRRYPPVQWRKVSTWIAHLPACGFIGLIYSMWLAMWESLLNPWALSHGSDPFRETWPHKFYGGMLADLILYSVLLLVVYLFDSRAKLALQQAETARLNEQLSKAQLNASRRQIEPHFLFNALNSIAGLVREYQNDAAVTMIAGLSDFLRRVLEHSEHHQVPLAEYIGYYHEDRTHLGLAKDTLPGRPVESRSAFGSRIDSLPRLGGVHHRSTSRHS